jgi:hypothetical protein
MGFTVSNRITIHGAPEQLKTAVRESLNSANPKWIENDKRGYWNGKTPCI